ncbi:MAG: hypothetical protein MI861_09210, partial [Pirellulales bacterium]|nr:hypothetical protein [Pirellulales bacterium]
LDRIELQSSVIDPQSTGGAGPPNTARSSAAPPPAEFKVQPDAGGSPRAPLGEQPLLIPTPAEEIVVPQLPR